MAGIVPQVQVHPKLYLYRSLRLLPVIAQKKRILTPEELSLLSNNTHTHTHTHTHVHAHTHTHTHTHMLC
jgi:hypothetical protein